MNIVSGLVKLLIFCAIIMAGIIFISDGFLARVELGVNRVQDYARGVVQNKGPAITQDFSAQTKETKTEIGNLSRNISWSAWNDFKSWVAQKISAVWQNFAK